MTPMSGRTGWGVGGVLAACGRAWGRLAAGAGAGACEALEGRVLMSGSVHAPAAPTDLALVSASATSIKIAWNESDPSAGGFYVMRAEGSGSFKQVAKVSASKHTYTDKNVKSNRGYRYEVAAYQGKAKSAYTPILAAQTPLAAPTKLVGALKSPTTAKLEWKNADSNASTLRVLRSTDGVHFVQVASLKGGKASSYTDKSVATGQQYTYKIEAVSGGAVAESPTTKVTVALKAPTSVKATASASAVALAWGGLDPAARSYIVMRSTDGKNFGTVTTLPSYTTVYTDVSVSSMTAYTYQVVAANDVAPAGVSAPVKATTAMLAPVNVSAAASGINIAVTWSEANKGSASYAVLRSVDGINFTQVGTVASGASKRFVDTGLVGGKQYSYKVRGSSGSFTSGLSDATIITAPLGTATVSITTRYGRELVVTASGQGDTVRVSQSGGLVTIATGGKTFAGLSAPGGVFVYDRGAADSVIIDSSVSARTTVTGIGNTVTNVSSANPNTSIWLDTNDVFSGAGSVHWVGSFAGGVGKGTGVALPNPSDAGSTMRVNASLWGNGPTVEDIRQGGVGDCYFLASIAAFAKTETAVLRESAVDLGDGTYAVQFMRNNAPVYVRVSADLPAGGFSGYKYAQPGASGSLWGPVLEKAYAYFRSGANTYASINIGWMSEAYSALGQRSADFIVAGTDSSFAASMIYSLSHGQAVTFATSSNATLLVPNHAYSLNSIAFDARGTAYYTLKNPWGTAGTSAESSAGYVSLTMAQLRINMTAGVRAA